MKKQDNEQLCALAQKGDTEARDLLLKNNMGFIRKTANEIYMKSNLAESDLSTETSDLEQEGCLGLLTAIPLFDSSKGIKFLTYAAPFIRNTMTDLIRDVFSQYEQRMTSTTDGLALQKIRLDEILPGEERLLRIELLIRLSNLRNRFMWTKKPCESCTRVWADFPSVSKPICCTAMALRTMWSIR